MCVRVCVGRFYFLAVLFNSPNLIWLSFYFIILDFRLTGRQSLNASVEMNETEMVKQTVVYIIGF